MSSLLEPVTIGGEIPLRNRVVMGSMTRNRCVDDFKPGPAQVKHYADRARDGTGLIVNEGTFVDWMGCDWKYSPVMITDEHAEAWRKVVDAVHEEGGKIFFQAWHPGKGLSCPWRRRIARSDLFPPQAAVSTTGCLLWKKRTGPC